MKTDLIARLIAIFVRESEPWLREMDQCLGVLERDPSDKAALLSLTHRFHSFAGLGGVDGFDSINTLGSRGEAECRRALNRDTAPAAEELLAWRGIADSLTARVQALVPPVR